MSWTVTQLAQQLCEETGKDWTDTDSLDEVEGYVNEVWKDIARETDWPWLYTVETISVTASTQEYSLATTAAQPLGVRFSGSTDRELIHVPVERLLSFDMELTGTPTHWFPTGYDSATGKSKIKLWPIPSGSETMEVHEVIRPTDLADDDVIPMPEEFIPIMKAGVRVHIGMALGDDHVAEFYGGKYALDLKKAKGKYSGAAAATGQRQYADLPGRKGHNSRLPGNYPYTGL